jgi:glutathione-regulated potassium-efflux system ancillary protein KefC
MTGVWALAALWLSLALTASLTSIWLGISTALSEIVVGTIAQLIIAAAVGGAVLGTDESWVKFLSGVGAIVLTFLAGAELDPLVFRLKWKEAAAVGLASSFFPFIGCAAAAYYGLGWEPMPSWLAGVAMSTTSVAVVYAVMLEFGFNVTDYGKTALAACFVTDLGTVVALGLIFAPFTMKTLIFLGVERWSSSCSRGSRRASCAFTAIVPQSWKPSTCFSACWAWERSRPGPTAKRCCRPILLVWYLLAPLARTTPSFGDSVR